MKFVIEVLHIFFCFFFFFPWPGSITTIQNLTHIGTYLVAEAAEAKFKEVMTSYEAIKKDRKENPNQ